MDLLKYFPENDEKPMDNPVTDGGYCGIFRRIACIGDSLASGEFESLDKEGNPGFHDFYDYSWGQYLGRLAGIKKVYNFSRGGMSAKWYLDSFADESGFWSTEKACQGYIMALGVNDIFNNHEEMGSIKDIDIENYKNNKRTFAGDYAQIIQRYRQIEPNSRFFLVTPPSPGTNDEQYDTYVKLANLINEIAELFKYTYVIDLFKYAPVYDEKFKEKFYLAGHMNPCGYLLTAKMFASYIDFIIRHNMDDFRQLGFVGTSHFNCNYKWQ